MATKFVKGQNVKAASVLPQGPVEALHMDKDGVFYYMIKWTDADGNQQERWFEESQLVEA